MTAVLSPSDSKISVNIDRVSCVVYSSFKKLELERCSSSFDKKSFFKKRNTGFGYTEKWIAIKISLLLPNLVFWRLFSSFENKWMMKNIACIISFEACIINLEEARLLCVGSLGWWSRIPRDNVFFSLIRLIQDNSDSWLSGW